MLGSWSVVVCGGFCTMMVPPSVLDRKATSIIVDSLLDGVVDLESVVRYQSLTKMPHGEIQHHSLVLLLYNTKSLYLTNTYLLARECTWLFFLVQHFRVP